MIPTWRFHHSELPRPMVFGHTEDKAIEVENGFKFSLDIPTPYPIYFDRLDEEVKAAMYTMQHTEAIRFK